MSAPISLRQRLTAYPRELRSWINHPDQSLFRMEARWILRWFTSYPGFVWLIAYILLDFVLLNQEALSRLAFGSAFPILLQGKWVYVFAKVPFWLFFIRHRIEQYFHAERLEELAITPCTGEIFWPALCVAPAMGLSLLYCVDAALTAFTTFGSAAFSFPDEWSFLAILKYGLRLFILPPLSFIFSVLTSIAFAWCITLYSVSKCMPGMSDLLLLLRAATAYLMIIIPAMLPIIAMSIVMASIITSSPSPRVPNWYYTVWFFVGIPMYYLIAFSIGKRMIQKSLRDLRSNMIPKNLLLLRQHEHLLKLL